MASGQISYVATVTYNMDIVRSFTHESLRACIQLGPLQVFSALDNILLHQVPKKRYHCPTADSQHIIIVKRLFNFAKYLTYCSK